MSSTTTGRRARLVAVLLVVLVAGGLCTLRIIDLREQRDDTHAAALEALADALATEPGPARERAFGEAQEAAKRAMRGSALLLDPQGPFLLSLVERLETAAAQPEPPAEDASPFARLDWHIAHGQLDEAAALIESLRGRDDLPGERVALYAELISALRGE